MSSRASEADDQINRIAPTHRRPGQYLTASNPPNLHSAAPVAPPALTMPRPVRSRGPHPYTAQTEGIPQGRQPTNLDVIANGPPPIVVRSRPQARTTVVSRPATPPSPYNAWQSIPRQGVMFNPRNFPPPPELSHPDTVYYHFEPRPAPHLGRFANTASLADHLFGRPPLPDDDEYFQLPVRNGRNVFTDEILNDVLDEDDDNPTGEPPAVLWEHRPRMPPLDIPTLGNLIRQYMMQICDASMDAEAAGAWGSAQRQLFIDNLIERTDEIMSLADESDLEEEYSDDESLSDEEMAEKEEYFLHRASALRGFSRSLAILVTQISMRQGNNGIVGNTRLIGTPTTAGYPPPTLSSEYALTRGYPHRGQGEPSIGTQWISGQEFLYMPDPAIRNPTPSSPTFLSSGPSAGFRQALDSRVQARRNVPATGPAPGFRLNPTLPPSDPPQPDLDLVSPATSTTIAVSPGDLSPTDSDSDTYAETEDGPSSVTAPYPFFREYRPNWERMIPQPMTRGMPRIPLPPPPRLTLTIPHRPRVRVLPASSPLTSPPPEEEEEEEEEEEVEEVEDDVGNPPEDRRLPVVLDVEDGPLWHNGWQEGGEQRVAEDVEADSINVRNWLGFVDALTEGASGSGSASECCP